MNLTGKQTEQLLKAFVDSYSLSELQRLVRLKFDAPLEHIIIGDTREQTVFKLLEWARRHGRLADLIEVAHEERPYLVRERRRISIANEKFFAFDGITRANPVSCATASPYWIEQSRTLR